MEKKNFIIGIVFRNMNNLNERRIAGIFYIVFVYYLPLCTKLQIDSTKSRVVKLIESTLQISNLDIVASYVFRGEKSAAMPSTSRIQHDIIGPALLDTQVSCVFYWFSIGVEPRANRMGLGFIVNFTSPNTIEFIFLLLL